MNDIFFNLLGVSLTMSVIIILLLVFSKLAGKKFTAKCRYIIWALVLLRLLIPVTSINSPVLKIEIKPPKNEQKVITDSPTAELPSFVSDEGKNSEPTVTENIVQYDTSYVPIQDNSSDPVVQSPAPLQPLNNNNTTDKNPVSDNLLNKLSDTYIRFIMPYVSYIWLVPALLLFIFKLFSYIVLVLKIRRGISDIYNRDFIDTYKEMCGEMKITRAPAIYYCNSITSPILYGFFKKSIIIPGGLYNISEFRGIVAHELTHYKRRDLWVKIILLITTSLHWFNPFVHIAAKRCEQEMELSCDEYILHGFEIDKRREYGNMMLNMVKQSRVKTSSLTTQFNPKGNALKERIFNILDMGKKRKGIIIIISIILICTFAGAIIGCSIDNKKSINNIDDWSKLGWTNDNTIENNLRSFTAAFLNKDADYFEELYDVAKGTFNRLKTLKFGDYSIEKIDDQSVLFTFEVLQSDMDTLPVGKNVRIIYMDTIEGMREPDELDKDNYTEAQKAADELISLFPIKYWGADPDTLNINDKTDFSQSMTFYIYNFLYSGDFENYIYDNPDVYREYAKSLFNFDVYDTTPYKLSDGSYNMYLLLPPKGYTFDFVGEVEQKGNYYTFTVQFWADMARLVKSDTVKFTVKLIDKIYVPISAMITYDSPFKIYCKPGVEGGKESDSEVKYLQDTNDEAAKALDSWLKISRYYTFYEDPNILPDNAKKSFQILLQDTFTIIIT